MAVLYYNKIKNQEINFMTGETWRIDDVPEPWRGQVQEMLDDEQNAK